MLCHRIQLWSTAQLCTMGAPATSIGVRHVSGSSHQCRSACLDRIGLRHCFPFDPRDFHLWRFVRPALEPSGAGKTIASRRAGDSGPTGARFAPATGSRRSLVQAVRLVIISWKLPEVASKKGRRSGVGAGRLFVRLPVLRAVAGQADDGPHQSVAQPAQGTDVPGVGGEFVGQHFARAAGDGPA